MASRPYYDRPLEERLPELSKEVSRLNDAGIEVFKRTTEATVTVMTGYGYLKSALKEGVTYAVKEFAKDEVQNYVGGKVLEAGAEGLAYIIEASQSKWSLDHLAPSQRKYVEDLVDRKLEEFKASGGVVDYQPNTIGRLNGRQYAGSFSVDTKTGIPKIEIRAGHSKGTIAEELIHWLRWKNGVNYKHPELDEFGKAAARTRWADSIINAVEAWGFKKLK